MSAEDIEYMSDYKEFPTKESALDWLDNYLSIDERNNLIRALQQESYLNKIRAEIVQIPTISFNANDIYKADVLAIIDKYKAESEGKNEGNS